MKTKGIAVLSAILIACQGMSFSASAEALFARQRAYAPTVFSDISETDWFYSEIANCYALGLVSGDGSGSFYPYELISRAEVISIAARVHSAYKKDKAAFTAESGQDWYVPYIDYAIENKILTKRDFDAEYELPASRQEVAYIYANALPYTLFKNINTSISAIPDVSDDNEYYNQIVMLYRAGVITGKDETGRFAPKEYISRAEAAAILNRVADDAQRLAFTFAPTQNSAPPAYTTQALTAVEIASQCSPAVFYIEIYDRQGQIYGSGSGFFITADGRAVTNYHVIEHAYSAKIRLIDGSEHEVQSLCGYDQEKDIAVLQIAGNGFSYLNLGDSDTLQNGQTIFCVGSPLGLENTISEGIVSNADRVYEGTHYIQISAPISSGSSGGAVLNEAGEVIGISSGGFERGQNLNLAMPINLLKALNTEQSMTLKQFQSGSNTANGSVTAPSVNMPTAASGYYTDNSAIPDYGYVTGEAQIGQDPPSEEGILCRYYALDADAVAGYVQLLTRIGFLVTDTAADTSGYSIYLSNGIDALCVWVQTDKNQVAIVYYLAGAAATKQKTAFYPNTGIPDYGALTGRRLRNKVALSDGNGYLYCYRFSSSEYEAYMQEIKRQGFTYFDQERMRSGTMYYYEKGEEYLGIFYDAGSNEIWIMA